MSHYHEAVVAFRRDLLTRTLRQANGNKTRAARALGVGRTYLVKLLKQHGCPASPHPLPTARKESQP